MDFSYSLIELVLQSNPILSPFLFCSHTIDHTIHYSPSESVTPQANNLNDDPEELLQSNKVTVTFATGSPVVVSRMWVEIEDRFLIAIVTWESLSSAGILTIIKCGFIKFWFIKFWFIRFWFIRCGLLLIYEFFWLWIVLLTVPIKGQRRQTDRMT